MEQDVLDLVVVSVVDTAQVVLVQDSLILHDLRVEVVGQALDCLSPYGLIEESTLDCLRIYYDPTVELVGAVQHCLRLYGLKVDNKAQVVLVLGCLKPGDTGLVGVVLDCLNFYDLIVEDKEQVGQELF